MVQLFKTDGIDSRKIVCDILKRFGNFSDLNSIDPPIQFTYEVEQKAPYLFLDTKTTKETDGSIVVSVYRKPTNAVSLILIYKAQHPII